MTTTTELTIKGDVQVLRLQPGDIIVVTPKSSLNEQSLKVLADQAEHAFPGHKVVISDASLSVTRDDSAKGQR